MYFGVLPALVPIHSRSLQASNAVILRQAALCCLMIASAPECKKGNRWNWMEVIGGWWWGEIRCCKKVERGGKKEINVYLRASCARQEPRPPLSGSPRSEHDTIWPVHCPATPATHLDHTPPCTSHIDCCLCPPGTSAGREIDGSKYSCL